MTIADGFWFWIGKQLAEIVFGVGLFLGIVILIVLSAFVVGICDEIREKRKRKQVKSSC